AVLTHDDGVRKPDPWGLLEVSSRLGASKPVYVGDTVDDLEMVRRARGRGLGAICALVLSGHGGEGNINFFREIGAEWVARDVNEVLRVIIEERRSTKGAEEREGPKGN
ncbi:MAG TPA: HAD family hydrolase, partial [Armatimonadetes bacterium]|nr:HAD family hydrolase [Armatimonadota bacterium]